jgi:hypothetical protein
MKRSLYFFLSGALVLLSGCGQAAPQEDTTSATPTTTPVVATIRTSTPHIATETQQYYLACIQAGHTTSFQYDPATNSHELFCEFDNGYSCPAQDFVDGTCAADSSNQITDETAQLADCSTLDQPVCGDDGYTYANICVAEANQVQVLSMGTCEIVLDPNIRKTSPIDPTTQERTNGLKKFVRNEVLLEEDRQTTKQTTDQTTQTQPEPVADDSESEVFPTNPPAPTEQPTPLAEPINRSELPDWLETLISLNDTTSQAGKKTFIERCTFSDTTVFYQGEQSTDGSTFSTLYNAQGDTLCYPSNDFAGTCPSYFIESQRSASCRLVWTQ